VAKKIILTGKKTYEKDSVGGMPERLTREEEQ